LAGGVLGADLIEQVGQVGVRPLHDDSEFGQLTAREATCAV
jgi:hypothetical protein